MTMNAPLIAVTMGDPAGVGPEIVAKTFADPGFGDENRALVVGDPTILERAARLLELQLRVNEISEPEEGAFEPGTVDVLAVGELPEDLPFGALDARAGDAAFRYLQRATELANAGRVGAIATAPLNKEAMHLAGHKYPGHTEILAELTGTEDYAMMLVTDELKVIHVSTHVSLREAIERVRPDRELAVIRLAHDSLRKLGVERPRVAVAGLNPHAGESGLFGTEDAEHIAPAVAAAVEEGIDATGPWPPDTVMMRARQGHFDIVVVQYHDQGHIPV
jgi:4-hydroxythreonine-4-phosphate dehydrogenase